MKKFLSFLGSLFTRVLVPLSQLTPYAGLFTSLFPQSKTIVTDVQAIFGEIANVEAVDQAMNGVSGNGAAKLKAASPKVGAILQTAIDGLGLKVQDEAAAASAVTNITSNFADLMNACAKK